MGMFVVGSISDWLRLSGAHCSLAFPDQPVGLPRGCFPCLLVFFMGDPLGMFVVGSILDWFWLPGARCSLVFPDQPVGLPRGCFYGCPCFLFSCLCSLSHSLGEVPLSWPSAGRPHRRFLAHVQQGVRDLGISFPPLRSNSCKRTRLSAISAGAAAWRDAAGSQEVGHCLRGSGVRASSLSNPREGQRLFRLNCSVLAQLVCCSSFGRGRRRLRELYRARFPLRHVAVRRLKALSADR